MNLCSTIVKTTKDKREIQAHGSAEFPVAAYYLISDNTPSTTIDWHWHEEFEIIHIKEGVCHIEVPGKKCILEKGDTAIINANTLHYIPSFPLFYLESFVFSPLLTVGDKNSVFYKKYISRLLNMPSAPLWVSKRKEDEELFEKAYLAIKNEDEFYEFTVREALSELLLTVYGKTDENNVDDRISERDKKRIGSMLEYIHSNFASPVTLDDIASSALISPREALRCFKRTIGRSPIEYLVKYRLMMSADALKNEKDKSISEIASSFGFDSPSYFSKEFKTYYHKTPKEYRKEP